MNDFYLPNCRIKYKEFTMWSEYPGGRKRNLAHAWNMLVKTLKKYNIPIPQNKYEFIQNGGEIGFYSKS